MAVVIGGGGAGSMTTPITVTGGGAGVTYTANPWVNNTPNGKIRLEGADADIFVQGKSMKAWMDAVERRLLILEPKPELLEKYASLRQAYEHYKTLEAILYEQE